MTKKSQTQSAEVASENADTTAIFLASLPRRMLSAQVRATQLGIAAHIHETNGVISIRFEFEDHVNEIYIDETVSYSSQPHEIACLEGRLHEIEVSRMQRGMRRETAIGLFRNMSENEKLAVRENINLCI